MRKVLIVGGNGALGRAVVTCFREIWEVTSVDLEANPEAQKNLLFSPTLCFERQAREFAQATSDKFEAIICVAGGFEPGMIDDPSVFEQMDRMLHANLYPALLSAHLASRLLATSGLLLLTGAATPFKSSAPGILSYAISKTAVHSLSLNLATLQGLPKDVSVVTILPEVIDTPANRASMPLADTSLWMDPAAVADLVKSWVEGRDRPANGSFVLLRKDGERLLSEFV